MALRGKVTHMRFISTWWQTHPKIQQKTDSACDVITNIRNSSYYKWQSHYRRKKKQTTMSGKLLVTIQHEPTQSLCTQLWQYSLPYWAYSCPCSQVTETHYPPSPAVYSPAWAIGKKVRWICFWRDSVGLKDRRAWLLVLASETGELLSKRVNLIFSAHDGASPPFWPSPCPQGKPCLFLPTDKGDITSHPRRQEGMGAAPVVGTDKPVVQIQTHWYF